MPTRSAWPSKLRVAPSLAPARLAIQLRNSPTHDMLTRCESKTTALAGEVTLAEVRVSIKSMLLSGVSTGIGRKPRAPSARDAPRAKRAPPISSSTFCQLGKGNDRTHRATAPPLLLGMPADIMIVTTFCQVIGGRSLKHKRAMRTPLLERSISLSCRMSRRATLVPLNQPDLVVLPLIPQDRCSAPSPQARQLSEAHDGIGAWRLRLPALPAASRKERISAADGAYQCDFALSTSLHALPEAHSESDGKR